MNSIANSTLESGPVFRGDGTQLFGLDAELERKAQEKRDRAFERKLLEWIEGEETNFFQNEMETQFTINRGCRREVF